MQRLDKADLVVLTAVVVSIVLDSTRLLILTATLVAVFMLIALIKEVKR